MTIRNLDFIFRPSSVALVGASKRPNSVGAVLTRNLLRGGFDGPIMPVNPRHRSIAGVLTYPDIESLPVIPDLAVIATPPKTVPPLVAELAARGTRGVVVITAGFGEGGSAEGVALRQAMLDVARPSLVRIVGPNGVGVLVPGHGLNASFAHRAPKPGNLAFVAQSGAVLTSVIDWASSRGIGFSHLVSLGDTADVDFGDMLDYLANESGTRAILLYIESVTQARKFMSAARAAARMKPVIVVKAGRFAESAQAAASHTGAMTGSDDVYDTAFRRAGMLRVRNLEEIFSAVETLAHLEAPRGDGLAILTNGGGLGVMATDDLIERGGRLARLSPETMDRLDAVLPSTWSRGNPVDIIGDAPGSRYRAALEALLADPAVDACLVINCPTAVASPLEAAKATVEAAASVRPGQALLTSWLGESAAVEARRLFARHGIATYDTPTQAVDALVHMVEYRRNQEMLIETPTSIPVAFSPDLRRARVVIESVLEEGRPSLTESEAKEVLAAYGVPVTEAQSVSSPEEAAAVAASIDGPVVLKIDSPDIGHKSDVGGVALDLEGAAATLQAGHAMLERIAEERPGARIHGFSVQPFIRRQNTHELIIGVVADPQFGPVLLFGQGGTAVEVLRDRALGLPHLNLHLAREMMSRTRVHRLLEGYRDWPPADLDAIAMTLVKVSQMVIDLPEIVELDINPLLAGPTDVIALDARIRVAASTGSGTERLAIRPYPKELEQTLQLDDGRTLLLRPIRPEDEPALQSWFAERTPEESRLRFFAPMRTLTHLTAARFTQLDYEREMVLVLAEPEPPGRAALFGVASLMTDPDGRRAENAIIVRRSMTNRGLGTILMRRIVEYARDRGVAEIWGDVMVENRTMLDLCRTLGFVQEPVAEEPELTRVRLSL